jgi:molybdate transport system substrate-binding protein
MREIKREMETLRTYILLSISLIIMIAAAPAAVQPEGLAQDRGEILVSAAISLKDAMEEIGTTYKKQTGVDVRFNLGASGLLQKQIEAGAPVDVFASAGSRQMDELQSRNLILTYTRRDLVRNSLVLVVPGDSQKPIRSFEELDDPQIDTLAIGNPKTVPAGQYARQVLNNLKLWRKLKPRLILAENVRQVLDYVARGEVKAGIVYATDVLIARGRVSIAARAEENLHDPILYPIAAVKGSQNLKDAQRFINLALGEAGQKILKRHGFQSVR